ncbi:MAG TPA: terpene cyclase/mutase family protein [Tepidisphaeraceae bacterium]|nr:terpene cyclase/mutase family protein [Tepidisphaeraceae bacterium]
MLTVFASFVALFATSFTLAASPQVDDRAQRMIDRGIDYLKSQQKPDGGWQGDRDPPAITAIALKAIVQDDKYDSRTDFVARGYQKLLGYQLEDGGIYKDLLANYNTAIAVSALAAANDDAFRPQLEKAVAYLRGLQWTPDTRPEYAGSPDEKVRENNTGKQVVTDESDPFFGGWGYGGRSRGSGRPDLSNVSLALDALHDAGLQPTDPAFQNAIKFVTRVQNNSETNPAAWAGNDGGFIYGPADTRTGESMAGEYTDATGRRLLRSYGSMTYAGLKSFIYAGLTKDDPRVRAAAEWIARNWTLDENPGMKLNKPEMATEGLYYYYHTLARALNAYDTPTLITADGTSHDWRVELVAKLESLQKEDGSWAGDKRWMEANPVLVTSYVLSALHEVREDLREHPAEIGR